jgi:ABC transporter substrate binding protein (PQQ-dependent alcohol dehydrogenase system)
VISRAGAGVAIVFALAAVTTVRAQEAAKAASPPPATFVYVSREAPQEEARGSLSEPVAADYGWLGAKFGVSELNVNAQFLGGHFELTKIRLALSEDLRARMRNALGGHPALVVADLNPADLLALADLKEAEDSVIVDARTSDDALRRGGCRRNVFHVLPSWDMRAYALGHFLIGKGWKSWVLLSGSADDDRAYAAALRRAAQAAGARLAAQADLPAGSSAESLTQAQLDTRIAELTPAGLSYDVVLVTDASGAVGDRVMYNTGAARLVAGTQGLRATAWDPQFRDFAARGFAFRFLQSASREMGERDFGNWLAVAVLGEAVLRGGVTQPAAVRSYLLSSRFSVAALKGEPLTFRPDDQQLRQPILLFGPKVLVGLAPSEANTNSAAAGACSKSAAN